VLAPDGYSGRVDTTDRLGPLIAALTLGLVALACVRAARSVPETPPAHPAPPAVAAAPAPVPAPHGANPDHPPARTVSGRVLPSRDPERPPALGPNPAKVNVIVYSDFTCPVCRRSAPATRQIVEEWPGDVRLEFRQFAPPQHRHAAYTASAALAAQRQGKFWELHDVFFATDLVLTEAAIPDLAARAGLDMERFNHDYADPAVRARVDAETAEAARVGAFATPSFLINGAIIVGWASWQGFRMRVAQELTAVDELLAQGVPLAEIHARRARAAFADDAKFEVYRTTVIEPLASAH
jgi:protein-disulfide isomerase